MTKKQQFYSGLQEFIYSEVDTHNLTVSSVKEVIDKSKVWLNNQKILKRTPKDANEQLIYYIIGEKYIKDFLRLPDLDLQFENWKELEEYIYYKISEVGWGNSIVSWDTIWIKLISRFESKIKSVFNGDD